MLIFLKFVNNNHNFHIKLIKMDQYYLADSPQKFLMTQHYHSSLDEPNLDNVEAKLYATRQKNHQLAMKYFQNKYGSTAAYQQFAKTHNLGIVDQPKSDHQKLQEHLQRKARQIQRAQKQKFRNRNHNINDQKNNNNIILQQQQINNFQPKKRNNTSKNNPWLNAKKQNKSIQVNNKGSAMDTGKNIIVDSLKNNEANRQSQFINEFKSYLINRNRNNLNNSNMIDNISLTKSGFGLASTLQKNQSKIKQRSPQKKIKSYEQELVKKIFKEIAGETKDNTKVQKLILIEYLVKNSKIIKVLGLSQKQLNNKLMYQYQTKLQTQITFQQFLFFILKTVGKDAEINLIKQEKRQKNIPQGCLLKKEIILHFEDIFKELDTNTDLIVKRLQYTNKIANDPLVKKKIDQPAVYQQSIDKYVTLRRILERLELQAILGSQQQQKIRQYISWNEFLNHFKANQSKRANYDLILLVESLRKQQKFGMMEISDYILEIISQSLKRQDKGNEFFNTLDLIEEISRHPQFEHEKYSLARQESQVTKLPSETFQEVLIRIKNNASKFLTVKEFMEYFSVRGKPVEDFNQSKFMDARKSFSGVKVKFAQEGFDNNKKEDLDGYDSDPQMYSSNIYATSPRRNGRSAKKLSDLGSKEIISQQNEKQAKIIKKQFKVTIPVPFSFEQRQSNRPKRQLSVSSEVNYSPFKAKPIPPKVKDENLYEKMLEEDKKRIEERRKNNMIITLANQKPFSFLNRKTNKKTQQERQQFAFKAKPIPWFCSVDLLQKKKEAQMTRNQKIAKQAQQSLAKAKLPPRMQRDYQQKLAKKGQTMIEQSRNQKKNSSYRDPPNFDKLHRQFQQGMERKRKQNKVTQPQQFNFAKRSQSRPKTAVNFLTQNQAFVDLIKPETTYKKILQPKAAANSTLKYNQQVQKRRKQIEEKRLKEEKKRKEEQQRLKVDQQLQKKVQSLRKSKQNKEKQEREKRNQEMQEQNKRHLQWKKQRIQNGRQQPMLYQRQNKRDEKVEKMKKLSQISKTLKDNGIKGKQHDSYFKKEELLLLQDWQQLKDRLK